MLFITLFLFVFIIACSDDDKIQDTFHLNIIVPNGSPALSQTHFQYTQPNIENATYDIQIVAGADPLIAAFGSGSHEIIYAPTNLGAKLIDTGVPYVFAATINWGNFYLASKTPISSMGDLEGKEIIAFGENATPDILLRTLISEYHYNDAPTIRIPYNDSVQTSLGDLVSNNEAIVLLAEPVLSVAQQNLGDLYVINLQEAWEDMTGLASYPQAGIFVRNDIPKTIINDYLSAIENGINFLNENPSIIAGYAVDLDYGFPLPVLLNAIPRSNIAFTSAQKSRESLESYFTYILALQGNLINNKLPEDDFYYLP